MDNQVLQKRLESLRQGDRDAFREIYEDMSTPVYTVLIRIIRDTPLAEDLLQDFFVRLFQSPPAAVHNPRAYLFRMARNLALDSLRKPRSLPLEEHDASHSPCEELPQRLDLQAALAALPPAESQIVTLHLNADLKFREIASVLEMPLGTVLWRYRKAIDAIRKHMEVML